MDQKRFTQQVRTLVGKQVTVWTRSGEKHKGRLTELAEDYLVVQREQMTDVLVPLGAIDAISG